MLDIAVIAARRSKPLVQTALSVLLWASGLTAIHADQSASGIVKGISAEEIMRRAVQKASASTTNELHVALTYTKVTSREEFSASGELKQQKKKEYRITVRNGVTESQLVSVNGHAPRPDDLKEQKQNEESAGKLLGQGRAGSDNRSTFLSPDLIARYQFTLMGQTNVAGRQVYALRLQPKDPAPPVHHLVDRLLNRLSGQIWIDCQEFELVRADVHLGAPVDLFGGLIASLKKLDYSISRTRLPDGMWLNTSSVGEFEGRKLLESLRIKTKSRLFGFRPLA